MRHIIITRLNCGIYNTFETIKKRQGLTCTIDEFVIERIRLCKKLTMRSLAGQSNQHFSWWLVIDPKTPDTIRKLVKTELTLVGKIIEQGKYTEFKVPIPTDQPIMMTRLDSDDMLSKDYNKNLRQFARPLEPTTMVIEPFTWIRFDEQVSRSSGIKQAPMIRKCTQPSFVCSVCSMMRTAEDDRQIYDIKHTKLLNHIPHLIMHKGLTAGRLTGDMNVVESNNCSWAGKCLKPISIEDTTKIKQMFSLL